MQIVVELDAFSGRPNPRWAIDEDQACELVERVCALPRASRPAAPAPDLGYRGFNVSGIPDEGNVFVGHGVVVAARGGRIDSRDDAPRAIESFLLETAREHLDAALWKAMASVIGV